MEIPLLDFNDDPIYIDDSPGDTYHPPPIIIKGLRTAYENASNSGIIETLSMTLRVFFPLYESMNVFYIPEGTALVLQNHRDPITASLYTTFNGLWLSLLREPDRSSNDRFLIPTSWRFKNVGVFEKYELVKMILEDPVLQNPSDPRFVILRNGMSYFFSSTILFLIITEGVFLRAQDGIYAEIANRVQEKIPIQFDTDKAYNHKTVFRFIAWCYILWVATAIDMPIAENEIRIPTIENFKKLVDRLLLYLK